MAFLFHFHGISIVWLVTAFIQFPVCPEAQRHLGEIVLKAVVIADGKTRTKGTMLIHLDPRVPFVPGWLMSFVLKVMSPFAYKQMVELLQNTFNDPNAVIPSRMAEKPELYARLHDRVAASVPWHIP